MNRRHRASSLTTLLLLVVQTIVTILLISGSIEANDPRSKSIVSESSFEEIQQGEEDDNAVIIDGECQRVVSSTYTQFSSLQSIFE